MKTLILHPEIRVDEEKESYNPEFVKMIKKAKKRGKYKTIDATDVWSSLNLK